MKGCYYDGLFFIFDSNYTGRIGKSIELSDPKKFNPCYLGFGFFETLSRYDIVTPILPTSELLRAKI